MILIASRLDHRGDSRGGGETVLGTVVRCHVAKLSKRVDGRHDAAAAATSVKVLAAVNELQIVAGPLAVYAHRAIPTDGSKTDVVLDAGCSGR